MQIFEIAGFPYGIDRAGVNFLSPAQSFSSISNGTVYRQQLYSRYGFTQFANRLSDGSRVMGIFEHILPDDDKDLLVISKEYLYRYNDTTNAFDQIPNNSANPFVSFSIPSNDDYVSGTTYPFADGSGRFVFTGKGMDDIYFYDGTQVKRFTNTTDNPDYAAPSSGALTRATYVSWFGERLNFFSPVVAGQEQSQAILYSGIRTASGNGDKFNVAGSGMLSADTYEYIAGASIAGDYMLINFNRSNWTIEKTRDAFNPYFFRKIPSVLGTDAQFSAVTWNNETESIGKTGIIASDGKASLRIDNKIPYFTQDDISQIDFNLTYGGFDRINGQFLFSYRTASSSLDDDTQDSVLVRNYEEDTWATNTQRFSVFGQTDKGQNLAWDDIDETHDPYWARMDTTEDIWGRIGLGEATQKTLAGDDKGFVYEINKGFNDYFVTITGITAASSAVVTVSPCALMVGDVVYFENVEGMTEINGLKATVIGVSETADATTSITVNVNSTNFTAYSSGGSVSKTISFYAEFATFNPYRNVGRKVWISHIEFLLSTGGDELLVSVFEDQEDAPFKADVPIVTTNNRKAMEWVTMTVNQESNFFTLALKQESATSQVVINSIRLHCEQGGLTSS